MDSFTRVKLNHNLVIQSFLLFNRLLIEKKQPVICRTVSNHSSNLWWSASSVATILLFAQYEMRVQLICPVFADYLAVWIG
jgi:hypothetical protein